MLNDVGGRPTVDVDRVGFVLGLRQLGRTCQIGDVVFSVNLYEGQSVEWHILFAYSTCKRIRTEGKQR